MVDRLNRPLPGFEVSIREAWTSIVDGRPLSTLRDALLAPRSRPASGGKRAYENRLGKDRSARQTRHSTLSTK